MNARLVFAALMVFLPVLLLPSGTPAIDDFRVIENCSVTKEKIVPANRARAAEAEDGSKGSVAILEDGFEHRPGDADPRLLAETLRRSGYGVTLLKSRDLADRSILTPNRFQCLILPYGSRYPASAAESIKAYLKSGGCFLSTGGYAFDEPCALNASGQMLPTAPADGPRLNARYGKPGDTLGLEPDQIGVFDPSYQLKRVASLRAAPAQFVVPASVKHKAEVKGYAACSMLGSNNPVFPEKWGRNIPLVNTHDSFGRLRGPAGALIHNYAGPYAGSSWAIFGVTNIDLFASDGPLLRQLPAIMDSLIARIFLHSLSTDLACYRDGETVTISCQVANLGRRDLSARVVLRAFDRAGKEVLKSAPIGLALNAGQTKAASAQFKPERFESDLYRVTAELLVAGRKIDEMETGFAAYDPSVVAAGLKLNFKDNYFRAGRRPVLLSGTNQTGAVFCSANENPLVWDRDLTRMNECGLNIMRVLHFSPFVAEKPSRDTSPLALDVQHLPLQTERKLDALLQLCQKHRVAMFLSLHDWMDVELSDQELAAQRKFAKLMAERYRGQPGLMIDIQNEPLLTLPTEAGKASEATVRQWNDYLRSKYGSDEALKDAWHVSPPEAEVGSIPYRTGTDAWHDIRTLDADEFRNVLANRWISANYTGLKEGDPRLPVTVGFLQEYWALNKLLCVNGLDFANMHSYSGPDVLRVDLKLFDRRFQGKSISLGEFGSVADHNKRTRGEDSLEEDFKRYLITGHYVFGEGGSFVANWCWKDMEDVVFPWGINYSCNGPRKDILLAYRNQSLLMRQVRPVYRPPTIFLVVPVSQMLGGNNGSTVQVLYRVVDALFSVRAQFGAIDDRHLSELPPSAKLLIYPIPMSIPDDAYKLLKLFVERGGKLCITGDVSFDSLRRRTRTDRLEELCGVRYVSENGPAPDRLADGKACINVEPVTAAPDANVYVNKLGNGEVRFTPYPTGLDGESGGFVFSRPIGELGENAVAPASGGHVFRIPEADGSRTFILVNPGQSALTVIFAEPSAQTVDIPLDPGGTGMARFDLYGRLVAVEAQGDVKIDGKTAIPMKGHFAVAAADGSGLESAGEVIVIPFGEGEVDLGRLKGLTGAVVQTGDVWNGRWQALAESERIKVIVSEDTPFDIRIAAARNRLAELGRFVASELLLR